MNVLGLEVKKDSYFERNNITARCNPLTSHVYEITRLWQCAIFGIPWLYKVSFIATPALRTRKSSPVMDFAAEDATLRHFADPIYGFMG